MEDRYCEEVNDTYYKKALEYSYKCCLFAWVPGLNLYYVIKSIKMCNKASKSGTKLTSTRDIAFYNVIGLGFLPLLVLICAIAGSSVSIRKRSNPIAVAFHKVEVPLVDGSFDYPYGDDSSEINSIIEALEAD